jgi:hypothetical protein
MRQWAAAKFQGDTTHESAVLNSAALGQLQGFEMIEELTYEQLKETIQDD